MKLSDAIEAIKDASLPDYFKSIDAAELTDWQDVAFTLYAANAELLEALRDIVEIEDRDNRTDPAIMATDTWRLQAWNNAREAIRKHKRE